MSIFYAANNRIRITANAVHAIQLLLEKGQDQGQRWGRKERKWEMRHQRYKDEGTREGEINYSMFLDKREYASEKVKYQHHLVVQ